MLPMPVGRTNLVGVARGAEMGGRALGETQQEMGSGYLEEKLELGSEDGGCGWGTDEGHRWALPRSGPPEPPVLMDGRGSFWGLPGNGVG